MGRLAGYTGSSWACSAAPAPGARRTPRRRRAPPGAEKACPNDAGLKLPAGFCASIFADNLGHVRHMVVAPNGVLYVNSWSGGDYPTSKPPAGGLLVALKDTKASGHADMITRFGTNAAHGSAGGTGIAFYKDAIYAEVNDKI